VKVERKTEPDLRLRPLAGGGAGRLLFRDRRGAQNDLRTTIALGRTF
jgi:hypothetical protein